MLLNHAIDGSAGGLGDRSGWGWGEEEEGG
jgi:hypothetical protein